MKKIVSFIFVLVTALSLLGCGHEASTVETVSVEIDGSITNPLDLTMEELYSMDVESLKKMVETYMPNYRKTYKISGDKELTDGEWEKIRDLLGYQLWEKDWLKFVSAKDALKESESAITEKSVENGDKNCIYYAPTTNEIEKMTVDEYREYLRNMYIYYANGTTDISNIPDFTLLSDDQIEEIRSAQLVEISNADYDLDVLNKEYNDYMNGSESSAETIESETNEVESSDEE